MIDQGLLSGLPEGVRTLLADPPVSDTKLLELGVRWQGLRRRGPRWQTRCGCSW